MMPASPLSPGRLTPMLARAIDKPPRQGMLAGDLVFEPKLDGYRVLVFTRREGAEVRSRRGAELGGAFAEIADAAAAVGARAEVVLDGELVLPRADGGLDFGGLQGRARRRGQSARRAAATQPAAVIVFDILQDGERQLLGAPYEQRRARLRELFESGVLEGDRWALCPATRDATAAEGWLAPAWSAAGVEGYVVKGSRQPYQPAERGWLKRRARHTAEAVLAGVTGALHSPSGVLLGRWNQAGVLRLVARSTPLAEPVRAEVAGRIRPARAGHPWEGVQFSAGWGTREPLVYTAVEPELVVEFAGDTAVDGGRWRHPVRVLRLRDDVGVTDVPPA